MKWTLPLLSLLLTLSPGVLADVVYEIDTTETATSETDRNRIEIGNGMMRMDFSNADNEASMIFRGNSLLMLDHEKKSYIELDRATMEKLGATMSDAMKQMEEALKNVPESQRAMMEKMMKERMGGQMPQGAPRAELDYAQVGTDSAAGYSCRRLLVSREGRKVREMCVTDWDSIEGGREAAAVMQSMSDYLSDLVDTLSASGPFANMFEMNRGVFEDLEEIGGLPITSTEYDDQGQVTREANLVSASATSVDPTRFEPPAGYQKQQMMPGR